MKNLITICSLMAISFTAFAGSVKSSDIQFFDSVTSTIQQCNDLSNSLEKKFQDLILILEIKKKAVELIEQSNTLTFSDIALQRSTQTPFEAAKSAYRACDMAEKAWWIYE